MGEESRVTFTFKGRDGKVIGGQGILIGHDRAGGAVIPDGTHQVLYLKRGEFEVLLDDSQPLADQTNPQLA